MPPVRPLRLAPEWDDRFTRTVAVSAAVHVVAIVALVTVAERSGPRPLPLVAYTVEITDPSALGGRLPAGPPGPVFTGGGRSEPPAPEPKGDGGPPPTRPEPVATEPPAPPPTAPEPEPAVAAPPEPPAPVQVAAAKPEAPPVAKPEPAPELPKPVAKPEPPKPSVTPAAPKPEAAKPKPEPAPAKPAVPRPAPAKAEPPRQEGPRTAAAPEGRSGTAGSPAGQEDAPPRDAYAAAAERWRARVGGLGGTDGGTGPIGAGGSGPGGGGELVGIEFLGYRQRVIDTIRAHWTNVVTTPGLIASVRFEIAPDGQVSGVRLELSSGNPAYDASALRAVQRVTQLPPPPARYLREFREFVVTFRPEDAPGEGAG